MSRPSLQTFRRTVQIAVLVFLAAVPVLNVKDVHWISGNFFFFDIAGFALADPLAVVQVFLSARAWMWETFVGALAVLAVAALLGQVFCSWACPFGLLSELANRVRPRSGVHGKAIADRGFWLKFLITVFGLAMIGSLGLPPLMNLLSMPGWFARFFQQWGWEGAIPAVLVAVVLVAEVLLGRRIWCRWACPQSVLLAVMNRAVPVGLHLKYEPAKCSCGKELKPCHGACSLNLDPRHLSRMDMACNNCGDCVSACADRGRALAWVWGTKRAGAEENRAR